MSQTIIRSIIRRKENIEEPNKTMSQESLEDLVAIYNRLRDTMPNANFTEARVHHAWQHQVALASLAAQIEQIKLLQDIYRVA